MREEVLMVDSKGTGTAASSARNAWANADARLAGSAKSEASVCAPMIGCFGKCVMTRERDSSHFGSI